MDLLVRWISVSPVPLETLCLLHPMLEHLVRSDFNECNALEKMFEGLIGVVLGPNVHRRTSENSNVKVKKSDRWAYSSLFWSQTVISCNLCTQHSLGG